MQTYQLFVFLLFATSCIGDDWTSSCPSNCVCKWANGKKSVLCKSQDLTSIPSTLSTEIQVLSLNENNIERLNREEFTALGLANLQKIYLKKSNIRIVHRDAFKNLKILIEIDLSDNAIQQLDKYTFIGNDRLKMLYLYGNPLKKLIAHQFPVLPHLRTLDLHNCQIQSVDATAFANLELLELLNLKNNQLEFLYENIFQHMKNLKTLTLEGNPWKCNCKLRNFRNWYVTSKSTNGHLLCRSPGPVRNQQWDAIDEIQFGCRPEVDVFSDDLENADVGSNITFSCLIGGDPLPHVTWDFNGKEFEGDNVLYEEEIVDHDRMWKNLTIFNITNYDGGIYVCTATNNVGQTSKNLTMYLTEVVQHVLEKNPETFWFFGLILGTFGTVFFFFIMCVIICWCNRTTQRRRRTIKHIKGSVSFNDQEKKLLDLSITTNDRQDSCEIAHTPSTNKIESVLSIEPVQITIENRSMSTRTPASLTSSSSASSASASSSSTTAIAMPSAVTAAAARRASAINNLNCNINLMQNNTSNTMKTLHHLHHLHHHHLQHSQPHHQQQHQQQQQQSHQHNNNNHHKDEFPLNVSVFPPPPPEFCSNILSNPSPYGNIFISVSLTQDAIDNNPELNMYPDLLNIPNRVMGKLFPINVSSYATLPRNNRQRPVQNDNTNRLQNVINYQNLETKHLNETNNNKNNNDNKNGSSSNSTGAGGTISLCAGCLKNQDQYNNTTTKITTATTSTTTTTASGIGKCNLILASGGGGGGGGGGICGVNCVGGGKIINSCLSNNNNNNTNNNSIGITSNNNNNNNCLNGNGICTGGGGGGGSISDLKINDGKLLYSKYDNMGRRITASGNSTLSLPDEQDEENSIEKEMNFSRDDNDNSDGHHIPSTSTILHPSSICDYVSL